YFSISEAQMLNLMEEYGSLQAFVNQMPAVSLRMSNGKMYGEVGKIDAVSGIVDESTGAVSLRASFKNTQHVLRNGGAGTVILPIVKENCIVIPQEATYELQDKVFVWKVVDGKAQSAEVKVYRLNNGKEYVVESGLQVGEEIISEGAGLVKEGAEVKGK
ncbi:MAG: efflux RND transporter periplasmic adaptor subunit, partial [Bacteroidaceae bacterium]|nr:efflux RND transporter periplasmic adaptor subunit [Bacteroidaceae bacterium]